MDKIIIRGGNPLKGNIHISGAKNAALPLMAVSLLTEEDVILSNSPHLMDIATMANLLSHLGVSFQLDGSASLSGHRGDVVRLNGANVNDLEAPYDIVRKMRASVLVLGPLLARFGKARVSLPGGCAIGTRPIDLHLKALKLMGAEIEIEEGYVNAKLTGKRLQGASITFDKVSVGATENIIMAACLAEGTTTLHNAAREPEIIDLIRCLTKMGANITGSGTDTLTIEGVDTLSGTHHTIIPDRIEAGSYMIATAMTHGHTTLHNLSVPDLESTIEKLRDCGTNIEVINGRTITIDHQNTITKGVDIETQPYPGMPTDMQAQFMALMTAAEGSSIIKETIFESRFMHVPEMMRMGADIHINGNAAIIRGTKQLKGAQLMATDLRASVGLVIAALAAEGESVIHRMYHIDRGYERIEEKLSACGADIERVSD